MTPRLIRRLRALACIAGIALALPVGAQTYPSRPINLLVPLQAGSAGDVVLRAVAQKMSEGLGQPIVVENQAGVSGLLGAERVSRAQPDGHLIGGISDSVLAYATQLTDKLAFDPLAGFEPIGMVAHVSWVLVAHPSLGARTLQEFVAAARSRPGRIDYASAGVGSPHHIGMELLARAAGVSVTHIPYKGATQALTDVAGGTVPVMMSATSVALPFIRDGKLVALAVPQESRSPLLPAVPTFAEAGMPGFDFATWVAMYAPRGTPRPIVDRLNAELVRAVGDPAVRDRLLPLGLQPAASTPAQLAETTRASHARIGRLIREAGIKPE